MRDLTPLVGRGRRRGGLAISTSLTVLLISAAAAAAQDAPSRVGGGSAPQRAVLAHSAIPAVAADRRGRRVLVVQAAPRGGMQARVLDATGRPIGGTARISGAGAVGGPDPVEAVAVRGGWLAVWSATDGHELRARRLDRRARPAAPQQTLAASDRIRCPSAAADGRGGLLLAWRDEAPTGSRVMARRVSASGAPLGEPVVLEPAAAHFACPELVAAGGGRFVLAWIGGTPDAPGPVRVQPLDADGRATGETAALSEPGDRPQTVAASRNPRTGRILVAWGEGFDHWGGETRATTVDAAARPLQGAQRLPGIVPTVRLAAAPRGAGWLVAGVNEHRYSGKDVYAVRVDAGSAPRGGAFRVSKMGPDRTEPASTPPESGWLPALAALRGHRVVAAWTHWNPPRRGHGSTWARAIR